MAIVNSNWWLLLIGVPRCRGCCRLVSVCCCCCCCWLCWWCWGWWRSVIIFVLQSLCDLRPNPNGKDSEQSSQNQDSKHRSTGHPDVVSLTVDCRLSWNILNWAMEMEMYWPAALLLCSALLLLNLCEPSRYSFRVRFTKTIWPYTVSH